MDGKRHMPLVWWLIFLWVTVGLHAQPTIRLKAVDDDGNQLKQVEINKPWFLELNIEGVRSTSHNPSVPGLEDFQVTRQGSYLSMVNGLASLKYVYRVIIDRSGVYKIGPVIIDDQGMEVHSPMLVIKAGKQEQKKATAGSSQQKRERAKKAVLVVSVDKSKVMVGESLKLFVRFYYLNNDIALEGIQVPEIKGFTIGQKHGPKAGKTGLDGVEYKYHEWDWDITAAAVGTQRIPVFVASYSDQRDNFFGGFSGFLRGMVDNKRIHSNQFVVDVVPLPEHSRPVSLVGEYTDIASRVDATVLREGEATVFTIDVTGRGNLADVETLELTEMPNAFKVYPSKSYIKNKANRDGQCVKSFEYIVQAKESGSCELPSQTIPYFDTAAGKYQEYATEPICMTILPAVRQKKVEIDQNIQVAEIKETPKEVHDDLAPLWDVACYRAPATYSLPFWLLIVATLLPLGIIAYMKRMRIQAYITGRMYSWKKVRQDIRAAQVEGNCAAMYDVFMKIFQKKSASGAIAAHEIKQLLEESGFSHDECAAWEQFFAELEAQRYAPQYLGGCSTQLVERALAWIDILQKKL